MTKTDKIELICGFANFMSNQPEIEYLGNGRWYDGFQDGEFTTEHYAKEYITQLLYKKTEDESGSN